MRASSNIFEGFVDESSIFSFIVVEERGENISTLFLDS